MVFSLPPVPSTSTQGLVFVKHLSKYFLLDWQQAEHSHFSHCQPCMVALVARNAICPWIQILGEEREEFMRPIPTVCNCGGSLAGHKKGLIDTDFAECE